MNRWAATILTLSLAACQSAEEKRPDPASLTPCQAGMYLIGPRSTYNNWEKAATFEKMKSMGCFSAPAAQTQTLPRQPTAEELRKSEYRKALREDKEFAKTMAWFCDDTRKTVAGLQPSTPELLKASQEVMKSGDCDGV